jgi:3-dehydroquinate dehydratase-2
LRILVVNGPNVNLLGVREPHIYGTTTLGEVQQHLLNVARELGDVVLEFFQSNHEGAIIDRLQAERGQGLTGCILNPGGLTHYSVSLYDCIKSVDYPFVEVHISNIAKREDWRRHSLISPAVAGSVIGLGWRGYELALRYLAAAANES